MTIPTKAQVAPPPSTIEDVLIRGDLSKLTEKQRTEYYMRVCQSVGLNPLTRPFDYLVLNGKLQLYARRDACDQLRQIHGISIDLPSEEFKNGIYTVHARASNKDGRHDEDLGAVSFPENFKGDAAANAILKAVTKAKRRVTLSICGLGFLDETEVETIPSAKPIEPIEHDSQTGEVTEGRTLPPSIKDDPEEFHKWLKRETDACTDVQGMTGIYWIVQPQLDNAFPSDKDHALNIFKARKAILEKTNAQP